MISKTYNHSAHKIIIRVSGVRVPPPLPPPKLKLLRFLPWWWRRDEAGKLMLTLRYGSQRTELKPGKPAIEVGEKEHLVPTLKLVREAVAAGELDKLLMTAKEQRRSGGDVEPFQSHRHHGRIADL